MIATASVAGADRRLHQMSHRGQLWAKTIKISEEVRSSYLVCIVLGIHVLLYYLANEVYISMQKSTLHKSKNPFRHSFISGCMCRGTPGFDLPTQNRAGSSNLNSVPGSGSGTES